MLSDLGTNLNQGAFQAVVDTALVGVGAAINDLAGLGAKLGTAQQLTTNASSRLLVQSDLITQQVTAMEKVDPEEASVRVTNLETQLDYVSGADRAHPEAQHSQLSLIGGFRHEASGRPLI